MKTRRIAVSAAMAAIAVTFFLSLAAPPAMAATDTWLGGTSGTLNTGSNWQGGNAPSGSDTLTFGSGSYLNLTNNLGNSFNWGGIQFNSGTTNSFVIGDGTATDLNAGNSISLSGNITNASNVQQAVNCPIVLTGNTQTVSLTGGTAANLTLGGNISGNMA